MNIKTIEFVKLNFNNIFYEVINNYIKILLKIHYIYFIYNNNMIDNIKFLIFVIVLVILYNDWNMQKMKIHYYLLSYKESKFAKLDKAKRKENEISLSDNILSILISSNVNLNCL